MMFSAPGDTEESDPECVTDIDTTAMAVQALAMAGGHDAEVDTHVTWLAGLQNPDGWWGLEGPSVNTTGVVVSALASLRARGTLGEGPVDAAIEAGAQWLANVQNADGGFPLGSAGGSDLRASAQAALGLARVGVADLVD
jgi:prenyltransferase beta subunit